MGLGSPQPILPLNLTLIKIRGVWWLRFRGKAIKRQQRGRSLMPRDSKEKEENKTEKEEKEREEDKDNTERLFSII